MSSNDITPRYAVASLLVGAGLWGVIWYPMRLLEVAGLAGIWLTFIMYAAALVASLPRTAGCVREFIGGWRLLVPLAIAGGWTNTAFVLAILESNVLRVMLLFYLSPIWTVLLGWAMLDERIKAGSVMVLAVALVGATLLLWDPSTGGPWPSGFADWLALSAGMAFATSNVLTRKASGVRTETKSLSVWIGVAVISFAVIILFHVPRPTVETDILAGALALGVFGVLVMTLLVQYGVTHMPVHRSAVILLFELVTGAISQQLLTDETMTLIGWFGGALIVSAAWFAARTTR